MIESKSGKVRDELITIYDINLEFLSNIDYNEIKKGSNYDLEKLLYIFIGGNERILDCIYNGDEIMLEIKDEFKSQIKELDEMLYYDPKELKRIGEQQLLEAAVEEAKQKAQEEERKKIIKNMIDKRLSDNLILEYLDISEEELQKLKQ